MMIDETDGLGSGVIRKTAIAQLRRNVSLAFVWPFPKKLLEKPAAWMRLNAADRGGKRQPKDG
jgi:hypothetical protein